MRVFFGLGAAALAAGGILLLGAQEPAGEPEYNHADCELFGPRRAQFLESGLEGEKRRQWRLGRLTASIVPRLAIGKESARAAASAGRTIENPGTIDRHIFGAMESAGVAPAPRTTAYEFARRVTLDLTGRIPAYTRLLAFVNNDTDATRAQLIDELLASPEWADKWTMFLGDLLKNNANNTNNRRFAEGRNAFYLWIKASLETGKRYDRMVAELISAAGENSYQQGALNWMAGGFMGGGPAQDQFDLMAANAAEMFLGMSTVNCILCHDGRRHVDTLNLWGATATRLDAYQLASFFSRTTMQQVRFDSTNNNLYYWRVTDNRPVDYALNTTSGNRPPRTAIGSIRNVAPVYPFSGNSPARGENYRAALARELTADIQFARATVNYVWRELFGRGLVEPANAFDIARLDPDNPPPEPWTLQPTHPRLLNELAREFIDGGYDLKKLIRSIVASEAWQLSSRYDGEWNPAWEPLFARKFVRRLWAEEVHDAVVSASGIPVQYSIPDSVRGPMTIRWAMQLPETVNIPGGGANQFLDSFFRGNRDTADRRQDGSAAQALNLMNDTFVMSRIRGTGSGDTASLLQRYINNPDEQLVNQFYLVVLSRYPTAEERTEAMASLATGNRRQKAEDLLWVLFNKTDFFFNY